MFAVFYTLTYLVKCNSNCRWDEMESPRHYYTIVPVWYYGYIGHGPGDNGIEVK